MPIYSSIYVHQGYKTEGLESVAFSWIVARALHSCELLVGYGETLQYPELLILDEQRHHKNYPKLTFPNFVYYMSKLQFLTQG